MHIVHKHTHIDSDAAPLMVLSTWFHKGHQELIPIPYLTPHTRDMSAVVVALLCCRGGVCWSHTADTQVTDRLHIGCTKGCTQVTYRLHTSTPGSRVAHVVQVARDVGTLWATLQPPSDCTTAQREALLLEVATASAAAHSTWKADQDSLLQVSCIAIVQYKYGLIYSFGAGNNGKCRQDCRPSCTT